MLNNKVFSSINIFGLGIGIAVCLLIVNYVLNEESYDKYHKDVDRVFRVALEIKANANSTQYAMNVPPLGPTLKEKFPEVEKAARIFVFNDTRLVKCNGKTFYENGFVYADPEIFSILTMPFIEGNLESAIIDPMTIVIPERLAKKYYGNESAYGVLDSHSHYKQ